MPPEQNEQIELQEKINKALLLAQAEEFHATEEAIRQLAAELFIPLDFSLSGEEQMEGIRIL